MSGVQKWVKEDPLSLSYSGKTQETDSSLNFPSTHSKPMRDTILWCWGMQVNGPPSEKAVSHRLCSAWAERQWFPGAKRGFQAGFSRRFRKPGRSYNFLRVKRLGIQTGWNISLLRSLFLNGDKLQSSILLRRSWPQQVC